MTDNKQPLVSIITVCLNSGQTIHNTLESVRQQSYPHIEQIIIDGVSTDDTLQIVDEFADTVACVVSEKDEGIYDAMNKGLNIASGDIIYFLNSDDSLCDRDVVESVVSEFERHPTSELIYGNAIVVTPEGMYRRKFDWLTKHNLIYAYLCHQVVFAKKDVFNKVGSFDLQYRIASDFDWLLRVFRAGINTRYAARDIAYFWGEGLHTSDKLFSHSERMVVKLKYQKRIPYLAGEFVFRVIRKLRKVLLSHAGV